jgi:DNA-binding NtrC family response regulator
MAEERGRVLVLVAAAERPGAVTRLEADGHETLVAADTDDATTLLRAEAPGAAIVDMRSDGAAEVLATRARLRPETLVVAIVPGPYDCVAALRAGADQVLPAPLDLDSLSLVMRRMAERHAVVRENAALRRELWSTRGFAAIAAESPAMRRAVELARAAAHGASPVLLAGERGVGKRTLARAVHAESSRAAAPYVALSCEQDEEVLAAALFGRGGGATGGALAEARDGTLLLDEVGALTARLQEALAAVLERPGTPPRLIASSSRDLRAAAAAGRFDRALLARLATAVVEVPPLRERREDVAPLARCFLRTLARDLRRRSFDLAPEALELLLEQPWPGNVAELRRVVEGGAMTAQGEVVTAADLGLTRGARAAGPVSLHDLERRHIAEVLAHTGGNVSQAARLLGIDRVTLYNKMRRYGIKRGEGR